jgi:hypothetical protein
MTADEFINAAIIRGQSAGFAQLDADQRLVFLISEAEVDCDMNGIDTLLDRYSDKEIWEMAAGFAEIGALDIAESLRQIARELPMREETSLRRADTLIKDRAGYDYEAILTAVQHRQSSR